RWLITIGIQTRKQQIFPFLNESKLKIIFDITTVHHSLWKVLSNMPIQETEFNPYNDEWIHLYKNVLISIDNIIFVVTDFYQLNSTETISMWCRPQLIPHAKFALNVIKNVTMYLKNYWINSKRLIEWTLVSSESKVDHVAIPNVQDESKQTLGFIFHREADIIYNEELDHIGRKKIIAHLVARNIIQKYIGNLLNSFYWFELWLNEGFIIFLQTYIIDEVILSLILFKYVVKLINSTTTLAEPMETTSDNLWKAMQSVINELDSEYQLNVKSMVHSWAMQRCFSVLQAMRNNSSNFVTISVQFPNKLDEKQYYMFPVTYTTESKSNFTITWSNIWLTPSNSEIELFVEKDQWIILNLQQIDNIAFVKSDFHETVLTETVSMWCRPNMISHMTFALYVAENITMYLKNYWNISERFLVSSKSKEYYFVIPNLQNEVKQTLGFVFYRYAKPVERTSDNLWKAMQKVIDELDSEYQFHIKSTVHSWAMQRCFPVLEVMRNYSRDVVTISVFFHDKLDEKQYYIPVTYTTESKPNFTITWSNISLTPSNSKFELFLEKDQWIILNLQQAGYYRVNYDTENWRKIARYLNSKEYKNIHVLNRAQIIDDAFHFAIEKKLESPVFWELATYLHKEKDYIAWYPMLKALEFISNTFRFYDCLFSCQELLYLLDLTWDLFRKDINDDRIKCLKEELAKWKCIIDDDMSCKTWANNQLQLHLKNPQKNKQVDDVVALIVIVNNVYSEKELDQINKVISEKIETSIKISDVKRKIDIRRSQIKRQNKYFQFLFSH
ncbi:Aminopeptidase N, partial [Camponotus floridanus]